MSAGGTRFASRIAWALAVAVLLMGGAMLWMTSLNGGLTDQAGFMLPFLSFPPVAALIAARRPRNPIGWLLLAIPASAMVYVLGQQYALYGLLTAPGSVPAPAFVSWIRLSMWVPAAITFMIWLPLLFPTGRPLSRRWWWVGGVPTAVMCLAVLAVQSVSWPARGVELLELGTEEVGRTAADAIFSAAFPVVLLGGVLAWTSLFIRYRRGGRSERLQIRWLGLALGAFIVGQILSMGLPDSPLSVLLPGAFVPLVPVAIAVAVLRYRLYEIDRLISRAIVYTIVTVLLASAYVVLVVTFQTLLRPATGGSDLAVAASTLVVAAAFGPVRRRVQVFVDHRFYRVRYDAVRTVESFGARLRDELQLDALSIELSRAVERTVQPTWTSVWMREQSS